MRDGGGQREKVGRQGTGLGAERQGWEAGIEVGQQGKKNGKQ
jgi:hypothetical protein